MAEHRADRPRRRGRVRAVLSLGIVLGIGAVGTLAYWSDDATMASGSFTSGTLDLRLDGNLAGPGGTYTASSLAMASMLPGESIATTVEVQNPAGSVGFTYTAKAYNTGSLVSGLRWTVVAGSTATNAGTQAAGNRTGSCSPGTTTANGVTLGTTAGGATTVVSPKRTVATGATEQLCIKAALVSSAGNSLQGKSATATFTFSSTQVGAP